MRFPALAALVLASSLTYAAGPPARPDVFLITIDTLRADHVHCYGYDKIQTPALDALAKDGIRFMKAFTPSPITNSSHTTILTGLLPSEHGVTDFGIPLSAEHPTWAGILKQAGYRTAAFIGAVILDSRSLAPGLDRGFDFYDNFPAHPQTKSRWGRVERRGEEVARHAETWLAAHPSGPRFVWVHLYDPHDPYAPPAPYSKTYENNPYDGEIAYADSALGKFVDFLKQRGWYQRAVIVVVGDHGEGLGEHGEDTHGIFLYDSTTHVPLLIKLPGAEQADSTVAAQVRTTDILPTVLDLLNLSSPAGLDGESLQTLFANHPSPERPAFGETDYPVRFGWAPLRSLRADGHKYIEAPRPELYDLSVDPGERTNLYEPWNEPVKKMRAELAEQRAKTPPATSAGAVGAGTIDELRALGYLGPADVGSSTTAPEPSLLPDPKDKIEQQNLLHRAMMASEDNRPDDARRALERILQLDPESIVALRQLGELELRAGDFNKAAEYLGQVRKARPDDASAALHLGQALEKLGKLEEARAALENSLKLLPQQYEARLLLGNVYLRSKQFAAAEDQLEAALLLQPDSLDAQLAIARALITEGRNADGVSRLKALSVHYPKDPEVFLLLSEAYSASGMPEKAQQARAQAERLKAHAK
jgi:arylsulfatase A-like enzyme/Tfp pilus assembly protein PilF